SMVAKRPNIELHPQHVDTATASDLVSGSKAMIIASAGSDMIVSGSYFFALSCSTHVVAIESPFYNWSVESNSAPGLSLHKDISSLVSSIEGFSATHRAPIAAYASRNFCDEAVSLAWNEIVGAASSTISNVH